MKEDVAQNELPLRSHQLQVLSRALVPMANQGTRTHRKSASSLDEKSVAQAESDSGEANEALLGSVVSLSLTSPVEAANMPYWLGFLQDIAVHLRAKAGLTAFLVESLARSMRKEVSTACLQRLFTPETDAFILKIKILELLTSLSFPTLPSRSSQESNRTAEGGILGLVSNVFTVEPPGSEKNVRYLSFTTADRRSHRGPRQFSTPLSKLYWQYGLVRRDSRLP